MPRPRPFDFFPFSFLPCLPLHQRPHKDMFTASQRIVGESHCLDDKALQYTLGSGTHSYALPERIQVFPVQLSFLQLRYHQSLTYISFATIIIHTSRDSGDELFKSALSSLFSIQTHTLSIYHQIACSDSGNFVFGCRRKRFLHIQLFQKSSRLKPSIPHFIKRL